MNENTVSLFLSLATLVTTCGLWIYTWLREGRLRRWALEDAEKIATKAEEAATAIAKKVSEDAEKVAIGLRDSASAMAVKTNADATALAAKTNSDAMALAVKVLDTAEKMANKVAENTSVSTDAAKGAKEAFTEANTINKKIADFNSRLVTITEHIENAEKARVVSEKAIHDEAMFNERVKAAIQEGLDEINGHIPKRKKQKEK